MCWLPGQPLSAPTLARELCSKCREQEDTSPGPLHLRRTIQLFPHPCGPTSSIPSSQGRPGLCFSPPQLRPLQTHGFLQCGIGLDSKTPLAGVTGTSWPGSPASGFWAGWPHRGPGGRLESIRGGEAPGMRPPLCSADPTRLSSPQPTQLLLGSATRLPSHSPSCHLCPSSLG